MNIKVKYSQSMNPMDIESSNIDPDVLIFKPILIDTLYAKYKNIFKELSDMVLAS